MKNKNEELNVQNTTGTKKKSKKKWIIIAVLAIVVLFFIAILGSGDDTSDGGNVSQIGSEQTTAAAVEKKIEAGNVITTKDLKISYLSCNTDFKNYNQFSAPEQGNKVIRAEFQFENISEIDQFISGTECYADDSKCELFFGTDDASIDAANTVSPGRKVKAAVYYEVPKDAKNIELEIDGDFWSNEKIIFVVK